MSENHLIIAAAGTGGHVMPGLAVAEEMKSAVGPSPGSEHRWEWKGVWWGAVRLSLTHWISPG